MSFRILSLDGGGSWALIQARVLQDIYGDIKGHELLRQFDMAIANSGGSLVLACLCNNMKMSEIIAVFETKENREKVFSKLTFWEKLQKGNKLALIRNLIDIGPKYRAERKLTGLIEVLKSYDKSNLPLPIVETPLHQLPAIIGKPELQLIVVGFDYFRERVSFFRSNMNSKTDKFSNGKYYQVTLANAIHASSNAPVNYFDTPAELDLNLNGNKEHRKAWYWDGAVSGFNNPALAGLIEALTNEAGRKPEEYALLSIGTAMTKKAIIIDYKESSDPDCQKVYELNKNNPLVIAEPEFKFINDISKMAQSILSDPPDSATFIAYSILDPSLEDKANIVRINPCVTPERNPEQCYELPLVYKNDPEGKKKFMDLLELDMDAVEDNEIALLTDLCSKFIVNDDKPAVSNQLIRGDMSGPHIGQPTYRDAKKKWLDIIHPFQEAAITEKLEESPEKV